MSRKHNKKGRSDNALGSFVPLERYLLNSPAWRDLSAIARAAYIEVAAGHNGKNNGMIILGSKTLGEHLRCNKSTAARALQELVDHGFITCQKKGGFVCKVRHASEWRLTAFKCEVTHELPLKTFMQWKAKAQKPVASGAPYGGTGATVTDENTPNRASRCHPRHREGHSSDRHGGTGATLLYSSHTQVATDNGQSDGTGKLKARAQSDTEPNSSGLGFESLGDVVLKSLAQLNTSPPDALKISTSHTVCRPEKSQPRKVAK